MFILWFGWYGFNPGSALAIIGYGPTAALCAINTTLGAAAGTLAALLTILITNFISTHEALWDLIGASNGTLGGLVGITAACSVVEVRCSVMYAMRCLTAALQCVAFATCWPVCVIKT